MYASAEVMSLASVTETACTPARVASSTMRRGGSAAGTSRRTAASTVGSTRPRTTATPA